MQGRKTQQDLRNVGAAFETVEGDHSGGDRQQHRQGRCAGVTKASGSSPSLLSGSVPPLCSSSTRVLLSAVHASMAYFLFGL